MWLAADNEDVLAGPTQRCRLGALALGSAVIMLVSACANGDRPHLVADMPDLPDVGLPTAPMVAEMDDAALVDACVQWVPIAAFSGDTDMVALWDAANHDIAVLADHCRALTTTRRLILRQMADELHASPAAADPVDADSESICAVIPASGETICIDT